MVLPWAVRPAL